MRFNLPTFGPTYNAFLLCSDVWDNMFLMNFRGGLTLHQFDKPPDRVLDLGCGSGIWITTAAKAWKVYIYPPYVPSNETYGRMRC